MSLKTTLIDVDALAALAPHDALIVDCRFELSDPAKGARDYAQGHVPGAIYASLDRDLSDLSRQAEGLGRHPLPLESAFSTLLSRWGWRDGVQVVAYDATGGALAAARLWWLLRLVDIPAAVLDGGYAAWTAAGKPIESGEPAPRPRSEVSLRYDTTRMLLDHDAVAGGASGQLLDARGAPRYRGDTELLDRAAGHVPGALNRPFADNLDASGHFKPAAKLRGNSPPCSAPLDLRTWCTCAAPASPPATTCWPWSTPACMARACTRRRGAAGSAIRHGRWRRGTREHG